MSKRKGVYFERNDFTPKGSKRIPFRIGIFSEGKQNDFERVATRSPTPPPYLTLTPPHSMKCIHSYNKADLTI